MRQCTIERSGKIQANERNSPKSHNSSKLALVGAMVAMSSPILRSKVRYSVRTLFAGLNVEIQRVFTFWSIFYPLVSMIVVSLINSKCLFGLLEKYWCMLYISTSKFATMEKPFKVWTAKLVRWLQQWTPMLNGAHPCCSAVVILVLVP
jgi:hypothetical protein